MRNAYTDSVLFSLPMVTKGPQGGDLIDLTPVFMSDLPQISQVLSGFIFLGDKIRLGLGEGFHGQHRDRGGGDVFIRRSDDRSISVAGFTRCDDQRPLLDQQDSDRPITNHGWRTIGLVTS